MRRELNIDWITIILYFLLIGVGWFNLYSTSLPDGGAFYDLSTFHGKQLLFCGISTILAFTILFIDSKFFEYIGYFVYGLAITALVVVLIFSTATKGAVSWIKIGGFSLQPTEFAKLGTMLALGKYMSSFSFSMKKWTDLLTSIGIVALAFGMILLQNDAGSALVFTSAILVFFREGLNPIVMLVLFMSSLVGTVTIFMDDIQGYEQIIIIFLFLGTFIIPYFVDLKQLFLSSKRIWSIIGVVSFLILCSIFFSGTMERNRALFWLNGAVFIGVTVYLFHIKNLIGYIISFVYFSMIVLTISGVTKPYQRLRFKVLILSEEEVRKDKDLRAAVYNLRHSKVAIGSGRIWGKGYGEATHTKGDFVPEEHTDYIFCVIGEEHGWVGSTLVLMLLFGFVLRLFYIAENSKNTFSRVFGYGVASIVFWHVAINIGMTIGLIPTIGIPLPFLSYGGSSMISFSMMTFVMINNYSYRGNVLGT